MNPSDWIADRTKSFDSSGIRKVFDLAANLKDPVNLSIGQPDFDVPAQVQDALVDAVRSGKNGYALTQGMPVLRDKLLSQVRQEHPGHVDRDLFVSSGTSGGLMLAMLSLLNPGDEVIVFDPYFVMYDSLAKLAGGVPVFIDTYPDFRISIEKVRAAITPRTKLILFNSPANPTGVTASAAECQAIAELAAERGIALLSDEIYRKFCYDEPFVSPAQFNDQTIVVDGFSKSHAMTGWRLGFVHGPAQVIQTMLKLQQYTFVCAPHPVQWAGAAAMDTDMQPLVDQYREKRDRMIDALSGKYEITKPGGAFYIFPRAPRGSGSDFVKQAVENNLLTVPGNIFSQHDTHFRISYAASDETIERGIEILLKMA